MICSCDGTCSSRMCAGDSRGRCSARLIEAARTPRRWIPTRFANGCGSWGSEIAMADADRERALRNTLLQRSSAWKSAADRARRLLSGRTEDVADVSQLVDDYRLLAHDLARARRLMPDSR